MQENNKQFGWKDLENIHNRELSPDDKQKVIILEDMFRNAFSTSHGKKALEHLRKKFEEPPVCMPEWGRDYDGYGYMREGQRRMFKYITNLVNASNNRKDKDAKSK